MRAVSLHENIECLYRRCAEARTLAKRSIVVAMILAGLVTSAMVAQTNGFWFKAKDPGHRPNPASAVLNPPAGVE
jgi:hypothetical protein